jgi:hypothetical protein
MPVGRALFLFLRASLYFSLRSGLPLVQPRRISRDDFAFIRGLSNRMSRHRMRGVSAQTLPGIILITK